VHTYGTVIQYQPEVNDVDQRGGTHRPGGEFWPLQLDLTSVTKQMARMILA